MPSHAKDISRFALLRSSLLDNFGSKHITGEYSSNKEAHFVEAHPNLESVFVGHSEKTHRP